MAVLAANADRAAIAAAFAEPARTIVLSLCAAWCDTCNEFRQGFERVAQARPQIAFVWLDIEDDADVAGDIDVENFPTLAIFRGTRLLHYGVSLPHEGVVARLIDALDPGAAAPRGVAPAVTALPGRFARS